MSDAGQSREEQVRAQNERADAIAALLVISVAVLAAIHFSYTGGLPAFLGAG